MKPLLKNHNLYIIFTITLLAVMGVASLTPAFPTIANHFNLTVVQVGFLITAFTVPGIFMAPVMGILADRWGRKAVLIPSLLLFGMAGAACALVNQFEWLLFFRVLQGMGAAPLGSLNITVIGDLFEGNRRATAMGYNASILSIGTASYPAIGGVLALMHWRYVFYLPLIAVPLAIIVLLYLDTKPQQNGKTIREFLTNIWKTINKRYVWGIFIMNVLVFIILFGAYLTFFPSYLETSFGSNSFIIGLTMSIMSVTTAIMASQLGKLTKRFKKQQILFFSSITYVLALVLLSFAPSYGTVIIAIVIFGVGHGLFIPTIQTMLAEIATVKERASLMSVNSMVLRIGQSLGPVLIGLFFIGGNFCWVFLAGAFLGGLIILTNFIFVKNKE